MDQIGKKMFFVCTNLESQIETKSTIIKYNPLSTMGDFVTENKNNYIKVLGIFEAPIKDQKLLTYNWNLKKEDELSVIEKKVNKLPKEVFKY